MQQSTWLMKVQLLCEQDSWESSSPDVQHPGPEQDYWKNSSPISSKPRALISAAQASPRKLRVFGPKNLMWDKLQDSKTCRMGRSQAVPFFVGSVFVGIFQNDP